MLTRNRFAQTCLTILAISAADIGCNKSGGDEKANTATGGTEAQVSQTPAELSAVLATIDGVNITVGEFQDRINRQSPYIRARYTSNEQKREFLDNLVRFEVLAQQAKAEGFDKNPDVVRTMKQVMIQKLMKARFETGISPDDVKEEQMRSYYDENPAEFNKPEEFRVSAIVIKKKAQADKIAALALGEQGKTNKGFRGLVVGHSVDDESKKRGGDLRYFTRESTDVPKEVIEKAFGLQKTGDVSGPIATAGGAFYIIKQTGHRKAVSKSFDEVKRQLQNRLYREMRTNAQKDFVEDLKASANIEIFDDKLSAVQIDTSTPEGAAAGHGGHGHMPPMPAPTDPHGHNPMTPPAPSQATPESH